MEHPTAEWLEPDGAGGFASGTAGLAHTRRYHALLLADRPHGRFVLVNGLEAWITTATGRYALSSHAYKPGVIYPDGRDHLVSFDAAPSPCWQFRLPDGTRVWHDIMVSRVSGETILRWRADRPATLDVRLLMSGRDYHSLHHENPAFDATTHEQGGGLLWRPYADVPATAARGAFTWAQDPLWFRDFSYAEDAARGLGDGEDLMSPGILRFTLPGDAVLALRADTPGTAPIADLVSAEKPRRARPARDVAADMYLAQRGAGQTILAGFPWFTDWGRDTFIAMRGLLIARGRLDEAAAILTAWASHVSEGMLPNRFPDAGGAPEYNAVDASLWFIVAAHELLEKGAGQATTRMLRDACNAILDGYSRGTRYGIRPDPKDGLLRAGEPGVQLTWMDAKYAGHVITPRIGKPVEVQALWVNALAIAGRWPGGERWIGPALRARDSVINLFPDKATGGLIDVLEDGGGRNGQIRPNQVIAAAGLPIPVLTPRQVAGVVAVAEAKLLTPLGLRTLAPDDPAYCPHYRGGPAERDAAYHQGTVWPWLLGPFVAAWLAAKGNTPQAMAEGRSRFLPPLYQHLHTAGLGHVSEVADGDPPHTPGGCPFQAWSMGELIRMEAMLDAA